MASDAGNGLEDKTRGKRSQEQEDEKFQGGMSRVMPPDICGGFDHRRRKLRTREHQGRDIVGKGENGNFISKSESRLESN